MPNTSFIRPGGILCSGSAYNNKKNPYEKLKEFLYEENTGRTDVVFFASAATGYEHNTFEYTTNGQDDYHYVGGLIDGFAKAILRGNAAANRPARKLYGTPVKLAYETHIIPDFDPWNNTTWFNPNTNGVGNFLTGCATAYNSYFYYKHNTNPPTTSNSNTGFAAVSLPFPGTQLFYQNHPDTGPIDITWPDLWASSFNGGTGMDYASDAPISASLDKKSNSLLSKCIYFTSELDSNRGNLLSTSFTWTPRVTQTPEQPQRFWHIDHPFYIPNANSQVFAIGIGYIDTATNTVSELFTDAVNYGYTAGLGISVGSTKASVDALSNLQTWIWSSTSGFAQTPESVGKTTVANDISWGANNQSLRPLAEWNTYIQPELNNKQLIVRVLSLNEIISIRSLTIKPTPPTNQTEYESYDGFAISLGSSSIFMRWPWANPDTLAIPSTQYVNTRLLKKYGLATASDENVSSKQQGLPYIWLWGVRTCISNTGAWQVTDFATPRVVQLSAYPLNVQLLGLPRSLSTIAPSGFFVLTQEDTAKMVAANTTIDKSRCLTIKPNLGDFFTNTFDATGTIPQINQLGNAERTNILGIFQSPTFKYCVTTYTLDKYSDEPTFEGGNIVVTGKYKTLGGSTYTNIKAPTNVVLPQATRNKANGESRLNTRTLVETTFNLNTINGDWSAGEFRFGFLGDGSATNTKGNIMITTHYGVDPSATNGIAFSHGDLSFRYRSGDVAYQNKISGSTNGRAGIWLEMFKSIAERQTKASLGGTPGISKKLIILMEVGVWELANPNVSYNGFNTWTYFTDPETGTRAIGSGRSTSVTFENNALAYILNAAILAGFTREEIVVAFYTPTQITKTNVPSAGNLGSFSVNNPGDGLLFIQDINQRGNFIRAAEIFKNNIFPERGLFNHPYPIPNTIYTTPQAQKALHIGMGSIPTIAGKLGDVDNTTKIHWYPRLTPLGSEVFIGLNSSGSLAIGGLLADYLNTQVSSTIYIPGWIPAFGDLLGETVDPVLGIDFSLLVKSDALSDINAYVLDLKDLAAAGNNLCREYVSAYKHKTLQ